MPSISLFVIITADSESENRDDSNRQIFISDASLDLNQELEHANDRNRIPILVNGIFDLVADDPKAIRREAQRTDEQTEDFSSLFSFLSSWPCEAITFEW